MKKAAKFLTATACQTALAAIALVEPFKPVDTFEMDAFDSDGIGLLEANIRLGAEPLPDNSTNSLEDTQAQCEHKPIEASEGLTAIEINSLTELINTLSNAANFIV